MTNLTSNNYKPKTEIPNSSNLEGLAQQWAKKYVENLEFDSEEREDTNELSFGKIISKEGRAQTAENLMHSLRFVSAKAWNKTEVLLAKEVQRNRIDPKLINPWEVAADSFGIYQKALEVYTQQSVSRRLAVMETACNSHPIDENALEVYTEQVAPSQLSTVIGADIGAMRKKYTCNDPRIIGFVSMQFHYTSQMLLETLSPQERSLVNAYFKVIDDHLYMPLQRAYDAAAKHDYDSPALAAVQNLLPVSTEIANKIVQRVMALYPAYRSYTGNLSDSTVKTSSIRDVEMFQVYLWVCALEGNISAIQEELFPLCVMLYPTLKVKWELVRQLLHLLGQEIRTRLSSAQAATLQPYFRVLWEMFSPSVFGDAATS